ncbi:hypothetical protein [Agromyces humi]|uniref:hypothetical protein n=1 Tax=Agromyces humi TaxID=1766800 RepID=UPI0013593E8E|nr:hypothetical protein [Agromyces humi]
MSIITADQLDRIVTILDDVRHDTDPKDTVEYADRILAAAGITVADEPPAGSRTATVTTTVVGTFKETWRVVLTDDIDEYDRDALIGHAYDVIGSGAAIWLGDSEGDSEDRLVSSVEIDD